MGLLAQTRKPFTIGFTGSTIDEALPFIDEQVGAADRVAVAMAGSGKDIAYLARPGRLIYSWDPQELSRVVVNGVFAGEGDPPEPMKKGAARGYAVHNRPIRTMPDDAAALVDWLAIEGSDYDRAALASAIIRSTYMGLLSTWTRDADADSLYERYLKTHAKFAAWYGLPGAFVHTKGSVFLDPHLDEIITEDTVLLIDTPKVLTERAAGGDIYSSGFVALNSMIAQQLQFLPPWTAATFRQEMPALWRAQYRRMLFFHVTGAYPGVDEVERLMAGDGVPAPTLRQEWPHKGRTDVCWVVDREPVWPF